MMEPIPRAVSEPITNFKRFVLNTGPGMRSGPRSKLRTESLTVGSFLFNVSVCAETIIAPEQKIKRKRRLRTF